MQNNFSAGWLRVNNAINRLPTQSLATELGWDYTEKKNHYEQIHAGWVQAMKDWIGACYPMPSDRTIKTGDKICQKGIDYKTIKNGETDAKDMWKNFYEPLLNQYKKHENFNEQTHHEVR